MPYKDPIVLREYKTAYARKRRGKIQDLKDNQPCADCKIRYPFYVMQFDHTGTDKIMNVSKMAHLGWETIMEEIAKCELVCANCHASRTHTRNNHVGEA